MTAAYVRAYYRVPAERGGRVEAEGKPGRITSFAGAHIRIRLDGEKHSRPWHPTWHMKYLDAAGNVLFHEPCTGPSGCCGGGS